MFGNCTQSVYREEGQSSPNEDNDTRHYSESQRISLQRSGTLGNELLLSQQAGNGERGNADGSGVDAGNAGRLKIAAAGVNTPSVNRFG